MLGMYYVVSCIKPITRVNHVLNDGLSFRISTFFTISEHKQDHETDPHLRHSSGIMNSKFSGAQLHQQTQLVHSFHDQSKTTALNDHKTPSSSAVLLELVAPRSRTFNIINLRAAAQILQQSHTKPTN
ncbi:hypothetical protein Droror1_Dr00019942 [Drosera rotundifolia]